MIASAAWLWVCWGQRLSLSMAILFLALSSFNAMALQSGVSLETKMKVPFTGDLEDLKRRRLIRVLVPPSQTFFFVDKGQMQGIWAEVARDFEKWVNNREKTSGRNAIAIAMIPTPRDQILSAVQEGRGDIAMANLTITEARQEIVDFGKPVYSGVQELLITSSDTNPLTSVRNLGGMEIHVRRSSSYFESLTALSELPELSQNPIEIVEVDETIEDEELLEMVNAAMIPATIIDSHKFDFWRQLFGDLVAHTDLLLRENANIAWAVRKNNPDLKALIDDYMDQYRKGTLLGNILFKRYLENVEWIKRVEKSQTRESLDKLEPLIRRYSEQYQIDWLIVAALAFQESRFDQNARNPSGATGVMQIKPSTSSDPNVGIKNINELENNVHAGIKYLRFIADRYFGDPEVDDYNRILMALASYNAGPNGIARVRKKSSNPNIWFEALEDDVASSIGMEPVRYVSNILRYYVLFKGLVRPSQPERR